MDELSFNDINVEYEPISKIEAKRIERLIVKGVKDLQPQKNKKKILMPFAAALIVLTGVSAFAAANVNISDMFQKVFGDTATYLQNNIFEVNKSDYDNGITLTVKGVAGDDKNAVILFDIIQDDQKPFTGNFVNLEGFEIKAGNSIESSGLGPGNDENMYDNLASFVVKIGSKNKLMNKNATLTIKDIKYNELLFTKSTFNIHEYFKNLRDMEQSVIPNHKKPALHRESYEPHNASKTYNRIDSSKHMVNDLSLLPDKVLQIQKSGIPLMSDDLGLWIDSLGFVDGKLHVRVLAEYDKYDRGYLSLYLYDSKTGEIAVMDNWAEQSTEDEFYMYYVYNIADIDALSKYDLMLEYYGKEQKIEGNWSVDFKLGYKYAREDVRPEIEMQSSANDIQLIDMDISTISSTLAFKWKNSQIPGFSVTLDVLMKDGTYANIRGSSSSEGPDGYTARVTYFPLDVNEIDTIIVREFDYRKP